MPLCYAVSGLADRRHKISAAKDVAFIKKCGICMRSEIQAHYGGLSGPPSKKHGFGKFPPTSDLRFSDFAQKCGVSPLRMAQRGGALRATYSRSDIGGGLPEKLAKKGGTLFWALFGDFGDFR